MKNNFNEIYKKSIISPEKFWEEVSEDVFWFRKPKIILKSRIKARRKVENTLKK